jgi:hypothetical protein
MIRIGSSRLVLLIGSVAIKLPFNRCGIEQSKQEIKTWEKYKSRPFNRIRKTFGPIIISDRCSKVTREEFPFFDLYVDQLEIEYPELKFEYGDIHNPDNWGWICGELVIVDYGLNLEIEKKFYNC